MLPAVSEFTSSIAPGSWPDWIAGIGTSLAFVLAALAYARDVKVRRGAQARLVYCKVTHVEAHVPGERFPMLARGAQIGYGDARVQILRGGPGESEYLAAEPLMLLTVTVHNGSDELIGPARVMPIDTGHDKAWGFSVPLGVIDPRGDGVVELTCSNPHYPGEPGVSAVVIFRDSVGQWWSRKGSEPVERVHEDPASIGFGAEDRKQAAANARLLGMEPSPEPRITMRVRWHRLARRLRGRGPIP